MEIKKLQKEIYENNVEKGFYDKPVEDGTRLMLITSELSEALEADRKGFWFAKNPSRDAMKDALDRAYPDSQ